MEVNTTEIAREIMDVIRNVGNVTFGSKATQVRKEIEAVLNEYL